MKRSLVPELAIPPAAINDKRLRREDVIDLFSDFLDTYLYSKSSDNGTLRPAPYPRQRQPLEFADNRAFWEKALKRRLREGTRVALINFTVTEWAPLSPGRFFTTPAAEARQRADKMYRRDEYEYLPLGKQEMILGGVGSIRLASKVFHEGRYVLLGASSTGASHEGVPICVPEEIADEIRDRLADRKAALSDVTGVVRYLPKSLSVFQYDSKIPRIALFADNVHVAVKTPQSSLVTIAIAYSTERSEYLSTVGPSSLEKQWCYASFDPTDRARSMEDAIDWMKGFTTRYGAGDNPPILFDFDELYDHFPRQVEVSLRSLFNRRIDVEGILRQGADRPGIMININGKVVMGDNFENVSSSQITNRSVVWSVPSALDLKWELQQISSQKLEDLFESFTRSGSARRPSLGAWWNLRSETRKIAGDLPAIDEITRQLAGRLQYGNISLRNRLFDIVHASRALDSEVFSEFLQHGSDQATLLNSLHKVRATFDKIAEDEELDRSLCLEALGLRAETDWIDARRLVELGVVAFQGDKRGAALLFTAVLEDIREGSFGAAKSKLRNLSEILPKLDGELSTYLNAICSS